MKKPFPAYVGNDSYVFLCYAHGDTRRVYPELKRLHDSGINLWYDEGISPGLEWTQEIADAIFGAAYVLYFVSPASVKSRHCRNEIQYAAAHDIPIIAVHIQPTELPGGLELVVGLDQAIVKHEMSEADYQRKIVNALSTPQIETATTTPATSSIGSRHRPYHWPAFAIALFALGTAGWWIQRESQANAFTGGATTEVAVAVLPFVNMSGDKTQEYFSDGITEDILNQLAKSREMAVRPRTSSFLFKNSKLDLQSIGSQLQVTHLVEGSVRRIGSQVRITASLVKVADNRTLWSQRYDRELSDVLNVQDQITKKIYRALNARLAPRPYSSSTIRSSLPLKKQHAYDAYLRGRFYKERGDFGEADLWFAAAVELNPDFSDAWAMRARINAMQSKYGPTMDPDAHRDRRREFVAQALTTDPENAIGLSINSLMETHYQEQDHERAMHELVALITKHPNNIDLLYQLGDLCNALGKADLAHRIYSRITSLDPLSPLATYYQLATFAQFGPANEFRRRLKASHDLSFQHSHLNFILALLDRDSTGVRQAAINGAAQVFGWRKALAAYIEGDLTQARAIVFRLKNVVIAHQRCKTSFFYWIEGNAERAFEEYRRGLQSGEACSFLQVQGSIHYRATFPGYFAHPLYANMLSEFGLDPDSVAKIQVPELPF